MNYQRMKLDTFTIGKMIGKGGFAKVFEGTDKITEKKIAIKVIDIKSAMKHPKSVSNEINILRTVKGKNFLKYITYKICSNFVIIITEFFDGTKLYSAQNYSFDRKLKILKKIACAISKLHKQGIVHLDLKPANILIDKNDNIKIIDFGLSCFLDIPIESNPIGSDPIGSSPIGSSPIGCTIKRVGTPNYMAPEIISKNIKDTKDLIKSDVYSFGVIMFLLFNGHLPFLCKDRQELFTKKLTTKNQQSKSGNESLDEIINSCLEKNLNDRPTMDQICSFLKKK